MVVWSEIVARSLAYKHRLNSCRRQFSMRRKRLHIPIQDNRGLDSNFSTDIGGHITKAKDSAQEFDTCIIRNRNDRVSALTTIKTGTFIFYLRACNTSLDRFLSHNFFSPS